MKMPADILMNFAFYDFLRMEAPQTIADEQKRKSDLKKKHKSNFWKPHYIQTFINTHINMYTYVCRNDDSFPLFEEKQSE